MRYVGQENLVSVWLARPIGKKDEGKRDSESVLSVANSLLGKGKRRTGGM